MRWSRPVPLVQTLLVQVAVALVSVALATARERAALLVLLQVRAVR
jgi:hypothetical protein